MALNVLLARAARAGLGAARSSARGAASLAEGGGSCGERGVPACAPCQPAQQPPCRARALAPRCGARVVCCPPPQGARPPCPRPAPACPLTCRDAVRKDCVSSSRESLPHANPHRNEQKWCGCDQDPVALRLQLARCARRADYEREVTIRATACPAPPPCPAPYALGGERECARATDGCTYAVLRERPPGPARRPPARCGPGRTPPPPRCVELAPDDACLIKTDGHLDPCAHRPRVMIEIDRSATMPSLTSACAGKSFDSCTKTVTKQPAPTSPQSCTSGSGSAKSEHPPWCANPPPPATVPPRCRRLTIAERLRTRPPGCQSERRTHTSVALSKAGTCEKSVSSDLGGMLRLKEQLKEAGLGRVVTDTGTGRATQSVPPGGRLELCVPPGTDRVAVQVSLLREAISTCPAPASTSASCAPASCRRSSCPPSCVPTSSISRATCNLDANSGRRDPWLPIKKLQLKLTGRCNEGLGDVKVNAPSVDGGCGGPTLSKPARSARSPNDSKTATKRCSSTSTFLANTIIVNP